MATPQINVAPPKHSGIMEQAPQGRRDRWPRSARAKSGGGYGNT
jgi:hypothetical protein